MRRIDWTTTDKRLRRLLAASPAPLAALAVAMAASSTPVPAIDRTAEGLARITHGDLSDRGVATMLARLDLAARTLALRHDPTQSRADIYGLTPGWESVSLAGKPRLELGATGIEAQRINSALPATAGALRLARVFDFKPTTVEDRRRALRCLTQAIYYEAALEPTEGQEGVAQVVLNRVRDPNYPSSVCGVVYQGAERVTGCQFSFTCDGSLSRAPVAWAWTRAARVAERALGGYVAARVGTSTHYHADYVHPRWAPTLTKIDQIGAHIFYRWRGFSGDTAAFRQPYAGREPIIDEARFARPRIAPPAAVTTADGAAVLDAEGKPVENARTVVVDGQTRVVGVVSLGGRRMPTPDEIAQINARLSALETPQAPTVAVEPAPPGVTPMMVEEVGRPAA